MVLLIFCFKCAGDDRNNLTNIKIKDHSEDVPKQLNGRRNKDACVGNMLKDFWEIEEKSENEEY